MTAPDRPTETIGIAELLPMAHFAMLVADLAEAACDGDPEKYGIVEAAFRDFVQSLVDRSAARREPDADAIYATVERCKRELHESPTAWIRNAVRAGIALARAHPSAPRGIEALRKPHQPFCNVRAPAHFVRVDDDPPEGECDCDSKGWNDALDAVIALSSLSPEEGT